MIDWKISVGAILGILLSVLLGHRLSKRRDSEKEFKNRILKFKESFIPFLKELENPNANPAILVTQNYPEQDQEARKLLYHLNNRRKNVFKKHWNLYTQVYEGKKDLGITGLLATEVDDISKANPGTPEGIAYLYSQTEKRRQEVIDIITKVLNTI